jgi:hypothetical protein
MEANRHRRSILAVPGLVDTPPGVRPACGALHGHSTAEHRIAAGVGNALHPSGGDNMAGRAGRGPERRDKGAGCRFSVSPFPSSAPPGNQTAK